MKNDPVLNKAALLAKKRDFEGAIRILKDEEDRYYGSFKYYYLYGVVCLHAGNFVEAKMNFDQARKIKIKDTSTMLGHAVLYLKRMNTVQALEYYLNVQEAEPKNKIVKRALAAIRKYSAGEALSDWMTENLQKLFPPIPAPAITKKTIINISLISVAAIILVITVLANTNIFGRSFSAKNQRPTADFTLSSQERNSPVQIEDGYYRYILTREQALSQYDRALSLFTSYRDEAAKINLNRILESNASDSIKNRARLLIGNMDVPGFNTFKRGDNPTFNDVKNEPFIYRDVHVIWRGMATNVEVTDDFTRFDFLVGYDTRRTLEGIIPVIFYSPVAVNAERPLEVLGRISISQHSDIGIIGVAIHQSGRLEN